MNPSNTIVIDSKNQTDYGLFNLAIIGLLCLLCLGKIVYTLVIIVLLCKNLRNQTKNENAKHIIQLQQ
jgi:hypothetical protein